jgi:hypothetical protein
MTAEQVDRSKERRDPVLILTAWLAMVLLPLAGIIGQELLSSDMSWTLWAWIVVWLVLLMLTFVWTTLRPLRGFFLMMLIVSVFDSWLRPLIMETGTWQRWFGGQGASWALRELGRQLGRLAVTLVILVALLLMGLKRRDFFLVKGQLDAPVEPVKWLGIRRSEPWTHFGRKFAIILSVVLLLFLVLAGKPSLDSLAVMLPLLPMILIFAALNAFNEELSYRAALLPQLVPAVGKQHALLILAAGFGLGHYYGVPYGVAGVLLAGFLAYILGKSMLETGGFFWAWFIHLLMDILIFNFEAMGAVTPGG